MTKTAYPDYIEILKLRKAHPIYQIAALILGIDPRSLKLMPNYHEGRNQYEYLPESTTIMYIPIKATDMPLNDYLSSESANHKHVPLNKLGDDLGQYAPSMSDVLYQELKNSLIGAAKESGIKCAGTRSFVEDQVLQTVSENTLVTSDSVQAWLSAHGFSTPFFGKPAVDEGVSILFDKNREDHSPELAIAVEAWLRFSGLGISHPKKYIQNWLDTEYPEPNTDTEDSVGIFVSKKAKERITTLVNWNSDGGVNSKAYSSAVYNQGATKKLPYL